MPDVIDELLERLSPASLEILDKIDLDSDRESREWSEELQKSLTRLEDVYMKRCIRDIDNKTELLNRKTRNYKSLFDKYKEEYGKIQRMENHGDHNKKIKTYTQHIESLEKQLNELTKKSDLEELFTQIKEMVQKIEHLENENQELTEAIKCYESFPASVREAQDCISDLKERIKKKEALLE